MMQFSLNITIVRAFAHSCRSHIHHFTLSFTHSLCLCVAAVARKSSFSSNRVKMLFYSSIHFALVWKHLSTPINFTARICVGFLCSVCSAFNWAMVCICKYNFLFAFMHTLNTRTTTMTTTTATMVLCHHGNRPFKRIKNALKWIIKLRQRNKVCEYSNIQQLQATPHTCVWVCILGANISFYSEKCVYEFWPNL